jgi:hypothetical protein
MPDSFWRHSKGAIIDTRGPNHDNVQLITAMKRFRQKLEWIAVDTLNTIVFGVQRVAEQNNPWV